MILFNIGNAKIFKNNIKTKPIIKLYLTLEDFQIIGSIYYAKNKY